MDVKLKVAEFIVGYRGTLYLFRAYRPHVSP